MPIFNPPLPFLRRRRRPIAPSAAPPALTLVAAVFHENDYYVTLTFDRPIDVSAMNVGAIVVDDGAFVGELLQGTGSPSPVDDDAVDVALGPIAGEWHPGVHLTATSASGIVALDDGGTWGGVTSLALPFP